MNMIDDVMRAGVIKMMMVDDMGEGGVENDQKSDDVIYGRPQMQNNAMLSSKLRKNEKDIHLI